MNKLATITKPKTDDVDLQDVIPGIVDDAIMSAAADDKQTKRAMRGGIKTDARPRAWSYGGQID